MNAKLDKRTEAALALARLLPCATVLMCECERLNAVTSEAKLTWESEETEEEATYTADVIIRVRRR
jgi:hypothetical protein